MNYITFFIKFLYRIRFWLILAPLFIASLVMWKTKHPSRTYTVKCSVYTGIITGINILSESGIATTTYSQGSMMDNLLNIVTSDQTLKQVSLRLYARIMVYGDSVKDNNYVNAAHYNYLYKHGAPIHHLIDKSSTNDSINEQRTYENLVAYETNDPTNYVYGIYIYNLPYVNRESLQKINVNRRGSSDLIEISYSSDDPGITYQTLLILIKEFINQYQELRFGETNNVIAYFEKELARVSDTLKMEEDRLTDYRIDKKVINYDEETKAVAGLNSAYELQYWTSKNDLAVSDSLRKELENRMGLNGEILLNNKDYLYYNNKVTRLTNQLTIATYYSEKNISPVSLDSLKQELNIASDSLQNTIRKIGKLKFSKEGIANEDIVDEWLKQVISNSKAKAELEVLQEREAKLMNKYVHFAPIGSTLKRRERAVNIAEQEYFSILGALNSARLRQKSLQMTSATLKVMDTPSYPLTSAIIDRKKVVIIAFLATLIFTIFFFLIIEILDHTLRYKFKAELLTGCSVIGAFTRPAILQARRYSKVYTDTSTKTLCNYATTYFKPNQNNIINLISNEPGEGKSFIGTGMAEYYTAQGYEVKQLSWHEKFQTDAKSFIQSLDVLELDQQDAENYLKEKIILVEYPSLKEAALTSDILSGVSLNLQIIDSRRTWKNTDQQLLNRTKEMSGKVPLFLVLNYTKRDAAEEINGLMPPYTFFRKLFYRLSQLGLTATDRHNNNV